MLFEQCEKFHKMTEPKELDTTEAKQFRREHPAESFLLLSLPAARSMIIESFELTGENPDDETSVEAKKDEFLQRILSHFGGDTLRAIVTTEPVDGVVPANVVNAMNYLAYDPHDIVRFVHAHASELDAKEIPDIYAPEIDIATKYPRIIQDAYVAKPYTQYTFDEVMTMLKSYLPARIGICGPRALAKQFPSSPCVTDQIHVCFDMTDTDMYEFLRDKKDIDIFNKHQTNVVLRASGARRPGYYNYVTQGIVCWNDDTDECAPEHRTLIESGRVPRFHIDDTKGHLMYHTMMKKLNPEWIVPYDQIDDGIAIRIDPWNFELVKMLPPMELYMANARYIVFYGLNGEQIKSVIRKIGVNAGISDRRHEFHHCRDFECSDSAKYTHIYHCKNFTVRCKESVHIYSSENAIVDTLLYTTIKNSFNIIVVRDPSPIGLAESYIRAPREFLPWRWDY